MRKFHNLLVGVDVDATGQLTSGSKPVVAQALLLARKHGARLVFMHVIDLPEPQRTVLALQPQSPASRHQRQVNELLDQLVVDAQRQGIHARGRLVFGQDWRELILDVHQEQHDLVLVGTRGRSIAGRALFGSTGNRLLRYCPCPVWSVKGTAPLRAVLVAHDLSDTGQSALALGALLADQQQAELHVLHVLELPEERQVFGSLPAAELEQRQLAALETLRERVAAAGGSASVQISIGSGNPHASILDYLQRHPVDLLCMGTVARSGLQGLLTGNTAENVLPWIDCSLIAVKPQGFISPVLRDDADLHPVRKQARSS